MLPHDNDERHAHLAVVMQVCVEQHGLDVVGKGRHQKPVNHVGSASGMNTKASKRLSCLRSQELEEQTS
jgi:hypothetical protein